MAGFDPIGLGRFWVIANTGPEEERAGNNPALSTRGLGPRQVFRLTYCGLDPSAAQRQSRAAGLHQLDAAAAAGPVPARAITGRGEILVPPIEPGDKPIILRPDDRPKKQSTRMLKA